VWIAVAAACFWLYFRDYVHPPGLPKFTAAFHKPGQLILNFLTFFGAPLGYLDRNNLSRAISSLAGLFILTTAAGGFAAALWHRRNRAMFEASLPWMVISAYLILSGTMAALGRTGFGDFAMLETTRYGEFSNYLPAALVFWEAGVHRFLEQQGGAWRVVLPRVRYVQLGMLAVVLPLAAAFSYPRMVEWHRIRLQYRAAMMFVEDVPSPRLWIVYPRVEKLAHYMRLMRSLDLIRPLPGLGMFEDARQRPAGGEIREVRWRGDKLDVYGWAVLPGKKRTADIVVLTAEAGGKSKAIAVAYPELAAPAWARQATLRESSGWAVNGMEVPAGSRVHAWAVDGETGAIYPLSGEVAASQPGGGGG